MNAANPAINPDEIRYLKSGFILPYAINMKIAPTMTPRMDALFLVNRSAVISKINIATVSGFCFFVNKK